jgi:nucleoside 2-deoxyribosyltransferase
MRRIYLASSWRNPNQPQAVSMLRGAGHQVYDFRNPRPGNTGFAWSEIDPDWLQWTPQALCEALFDPIAVKGFALDKQALDWANTGVLLLPCGRSAHIEAGYLIGQGKPVLVVLDTDRFEPELMYKLAANVVPDLSVMLTGLDVMLQSLREGE